MSWRATVFVGIVAASVATACGGADRATLAGAAGRMPAHALAVTNELSGDLTVVDRETLQPAMTIPLGKRPRGLVLSPDRLRLYVALSGSPNAGPGVDEKTLPPPDRKADGIGIVDLTRMKLTGMLPSGTDPEQLAVSPDGAYLFVANEDAAKLSIIDTAKAVVVDTIEVGGEPEGVGVEPSGRRVWVTSEADDAVFVVDLTLRKVVKKVPVGPRPRSVAFLPDGSRAYVPSENGATLTVVDARRLETDRTIRLADGMRPMGTLMATDGKQLFVSTGRSKMVLILDVATHQVVGSIEAGARPWGLALSPDGRTLFTANGPSNDVSVIDLASRSVTKRIPAGRGPWGVAVVECDRGCSDRRRAAP